MTTQEYVAIVRATVAERFVAQLPAPAVLTLVLLAVASFVCAITFPEEMAEIGLLF
ncbi:MAG: hypothetical protein ACHQRJ_19655 [Alphaproteobacteria bacterium]